MALFQYEEVYRAAQEITGSGTRFESVLNESAERFFDRESFSIKARSARTKQFDIFLSHAYQDKIVVAGLYALLTNAGYNVYVDWIHDSGLSRTTVTPKTAEVLRQRMQQSDSLMYATIKEDTNSKWMPWEAGFFDGFDGHVAILPVLKDKTGFRGREYLGLYPYAEKSAYGRGKDFLEITDQQKTWNSERYTRWVARKIR